MMKAAVFEGVERMVIRQLEKPDCPVGGVLIRVEACSICGGDVRNYFQGLKDGINRQIMGHEISGQVVEADAGLRLQAGDRVAVAPDISCGRCYYCKKGLVNLCQEHKMIGTHIPGGFAQYIALPQEVLAHGFVEKIPDGMSYIQAAFAEKAAGVVACQERSRIAPGETVAVIGDGPAGCLHLEVARARGAGKIISLARGRRDFVKNFCAHHIVDNRDQRAATQQVLALTEGIGADVVICAVPSTAVQPQALDIARKQGRIIIYGGAPKDERRLTTLDSNLIHYRELSVTGSFSYPADGLKKAVSMIQQGYIAVEKYITRTVPLEELEAGIADMHARRALNITVLPWR